MSVIIRLQNLPWSANAADIRGFFKGLSIPDGGVHIVGGENGDAFIAFSTDEDARQAMALNGGRLKETQVSLLLSSRTEMQKVIEAARQQTMSFMSITGASAAAAQQSPVVATPAATAAPQHSATVAPFAGLNSTAGLIGAQEQHAKPQPPIITASSLSGILAQQMYQQQAQQQLQLLAQQQQQQQQQQAQQFAQRASGNNLLQNQSIGGAPVANLSSPSAAAAASSSAVSASSRSADLRSQQRNSRSRSRSRERRSRRSRSRSREHNSSRRSSHRSSRSRSRERSSRSGGSNGGSSRRYRSRERERGSGTGRASDRNSSGRTNNNSDYDRESSSSECGNNTKGPIMPSAVWDQTAVQPMRPQQQQQLSLLQQQQQQKLQQQSPTVAAAPIIGPYGIAPIGMQLQGSPLSNLTAPTSSAIAPSPVAAGNAAFGSQHHLNLQDQQQHQQNMLNAMPPTVGMQQPAVFPPGMFSTLPPNMQPQSLQQQQQQHAFLNPMAAASAAIPNAMPVGVPAPINNNPTFLTQQLQHQQQQQTHVSLTNPAVVAPPAAPAAANDQRIDVRMRNLDHSVHYSAIRKIFAGLHIPNDGIKMLFDEFGNRRNEAVIRFSRPYFAQQAAHKSGHIFSMLGQPLLVELIDAAAYDAELDAVRPSKLQQQRPFNGNGSGGGDGSLGGGSTLPLMQNSTNQFSQPPPGAGAGETDQFGRRIRTEEELARVAAAKLAGANKSADQKPSATIVLDDGDDVIFQPNATTVTASSASPAAVAQQSCTVLLVQDLPWFTSEQDIMRMFSDFTLLHIVLAREPKNFHAFVRFHNAADAAIALKAKFNHRIGYKQVHVCECSALAYEKARAEYSADFVETSAPPQQENAVAVKEQPHDEQPSDRAAAVAPVAGHQTHPRSKLFQQTTNHNPQQEHQQQQHQSNAQHIMPPVLSEIEFMRQQQQQQEQVMLMQQREAQRLLMQQQQQQTNQPQRATQQVVAQSTVAATAAAAPIAAPPTLNMNFSNFGPTATNSMGPINFSDPRMRKQFQQPAAAAGHHGLSDMDNAAGMQQSMVQQQQPFAQQQQQQPTHFMQQQQQHQQLQQPPADMFNQQQQPQQQQQQQTTNAFSTRFVFISNMEYRSGEQTIRNWFGNIDVSPLAVHLLLNQRGQSAGEAVCYFRSAADAARAQMLNRTRMRTRTVTVKFMPAEQAAAALRTLGQEMPDDYEETEADESRLPAASNNGGPATTTTVLLDDDDGNDGGIALPFGQQQQQHHRQQHNNAPAGMHPRNGNNPFGRRFNSNNSGGADDDGDHHGRQRGNNARNDFDNIDNNIGNIDARVEQHLQNMQQEAGDYGPDENASNTNIDENNVQNLQDNNDDDAENNAGGDGGNDEAEYNGPVHAMGAGAGFGAGAVNDGGGFHSNSNNPHRHMNASGGGGGRFPNNIGGGGAGNFRSRGGRGARHNDHMGGNNGGRGSVSGASRGGDYGNNNGGGGGMAAPRNTNGCIVAMRNVPFNANAIDIMRFFSNFPLTADDIIRRYRDDGSPTGDARVCFQTPMDAQMAIEQYQNGRIMNRVIQMMLLN